MESKEGATISKKQHIMVGLSAAPSNRKIIESAADMARAFQAPFTAVYVKTSKQEASEGENAERLKNNIRFAENLGATVVTVTGDDISLQLAEYARLAGVTKIVIGRNAATRKQFFGRPTIADRLISLTPNIDIYIIPDGTTILTNQKNKIIEKKGVVSLLKDVVISLAILALVSGIGILFEYLQFDESTIITLYILGVLITYIATTSSISWFFTSVLSVLIFNFLFTDPKYSLLAYDNSYPITFVIMFFAATVTGSFSSRIRNQARQSAKTAYRAKILFEVNQLLQTATSDAEIYDLIAKQLNKLLRRQIALCYAENADAPVF
ncbi:MAG: DUF4118 domain-containing protein [Clostridia bacterium]|nr:DUF4118 domain-containing protein [Clostridia bacterium]